MRSEPELPLLITAKQILEDLSSIIVNSRAPKVGADRLRASLFLTIAEQFEAAFRLAEAQMVTHSASHVRSMIEALVAMRMLESNSNYVEQMQYEKLRGEKRVYDGIFADPNIPEVLKEPLKENYEACKSGCDTFRALGLRPKKISQDLGSEKFCHLVGPYSMLCAFSHNDLAVLKFRHEGQSGMAYKQANDPSLVIAIISAALMVLMNATEQFGKIAQFSGGHFQDCFEAMNEKWGRMLDKSTEH
ncbi:hypothetical protein P0D91_18730 [Pseudomonas sp. CBSPBW29]|uniref:DUF5677 domain-containing protein n=1 Tax=Pseudomonas TaxID=286 RepID=UPI0021ABD72C|nr:MULTISPECIES: DUF5677 domain-containing protein [unclassified Pseudomonas]UVH49164.1 hypothetical protein NVB75_21605 [Pseudomonas sp. CBS]WEL40342.1 hypothetical protein P0D91_18730 [Pseudomonas sp. CBSPBW29]WEL86707.1 hypothetical protein P0D90_23260 [Pseudomonas sp. CBSPCBW29]